MSETLLHYLNEYIRRRETDIRASYFPAPSWDAVVRIKGREAELSELKEWLKKAIESNSEIR